MAIKPTHSFDERELVNEYVLNTVAVAGTLLTRNTADLSVVGVGNCSYGTVTNGSISVAGDRPFGALFYDVTESGVTFFNQITGTLDYSSAENTPCALWLLHPGMQFETSAFLATGTGAITAGASSGNTAPDTLLGVLNGQYVVASAFASGAGSVPCAKLIGNGIVNGIQTIRVQVL